MAIQREIKRVWGNKHFIWFTSGASSQQTAMKIVD